LGRANSTVGGGRTFEATVEEPGGIRKKAASQISGALGTLVISGSIKRDVVTYFVSHRRHVLSSYSAFVRFYEHSNGVVFSNHNYKWVGDTTCSDLRTRHGSIHVFNDLSLVAV